MIYNIVNLKEMRGKLAGLFQETLHGNYEILF
jgi:hypothetical protein